MKSMVGVVSSEPMAPQVEAVSKPPQSPRKPLVAWKPTEPMNPVDDVISFSVRLPGATYERLRLYAFTQRLSLNKAIVRLIDESGKG